MEPPATAGPAANARRLISVRQAARLAGLHENTLYRLIRDAQTNGHDLAHAVVELPGHHLLVRRTAFERWLDAAAE